MFLEIRKRFLGSFRTVAGRLGDGVEAPALAEVDLQCVAVDKPGGLMDADTARALLRLPVLHDLRHVTGVEIAPAPVQVCRVHSDKPGQENNRV